MCGISDIDVELSTGGHIHSQFCILRCSYLELRYFILEEFLRRSLDITSIETEPIRALFRWPTLKLEGVQQLVIVGLIEWVLETLKVFPPWKCVGVGPRVIAQHTVRIYVRASIRGRLRVFAFFQDQHEDYCEYRCEDQESQAPPKVLLFLSLLNLLINNRLRVLRITSLTTI